MSADDSSAVITAFLLRHTRLGQLDPEANIFAAGHVNSLFALQLITFVEKSFGIFVDNEDLDLANFCSIGAIRRFVERKRAAGETERA